MLLFQCGVVLEYENGKENTPYQWDISFYILRSEIK